MGTRTFVDSTTPIDQVLDAVELLRKHRIHPYWGYQRSVGHMRVMIRAEKLRKQHHRRRGLARRC